MKRLSSAASRSAAPGKRPRPGLPHSLELYRWAVQHPWAEARFLLKAHAHYGKAAGSSYRPPTLLREDFAGAAAVARGWVELDENHRALAIEKDLATHRYAQTAAAPLGPRAQDLICLLGDVMWYDRRRTPLVDVILALNFSINIFHHRADLLAYFQLARQCLRRGGILILDAFGGAGAMRVSTQRRRVQPDPAAQIPPFTYLWEQRSFSPATARIDCRIHFDLGRRGLLRNAFVYDWRLWTLPELIDALRQAGFAQAEVWSDADGSPHTPASGRFRPNPKLAQREDWVAYVVAQR